MFCNSLLTRALAATAVAGIALLGPAVAAGAATAEPAAPAAPLVSIGVGLDIGATVTIGSGPAVAPQPVTVATTPTGIDVSVDTGSRTTSAMQSAAPVPTAPPAPVPVGADPTAGGRLVTADASVDACIAAALLGGRSVEGCGQPPGAAVPTLAQALARVGVCARLAIVSDAPVDPCGSPTTTGRSALVGLATDDDVCLAATVLGLVDDAACGTGSGSGPAGSDPTDDTTEPPVLGGEVGGDVCLGLALLTDSDSSACPAEVAGEQVGGTDPGSEGQGAVASNGLVADTASFRSSAASEATPGVSGSLPFTGRGSTDVALLGLADRGDRSGPAPDRTLPVAGRFPRLKPRADRGAPGAPTRGHRAARCPIPVAPPKSRSAGGTGQAPAVFITCSKSGPGRSRPQLSGRSTRWSSDCSAAATSRNR